MLVPLIMLIHHLFHTSRPQVKPDRIPYTSTTNFNAQIITTLNTMIGLALKFVYRMELLKTNVVEIKRDMLNPNTPTFIQPPLPNYPPPPPTYT